MGTQTTFKWNFWYFYWHTEASYCVKKAASKWKILYLCICRQKESTLVKSTPENYRQLPPFGPSPCWFMTSSSLIRSSMLMAQLYGRLSFAGSKFTTATFLQSKEFQILLSQKFQWITYGTRKLHVYLPISWRKSDIPLQYVVFPDPGGPITTCPKTILTVERKIVCCCEWFLDGNHQLQTVKLFFVRCLLVEVCLTLNIKY